MVKFLAALILLLLASIYNYLRTLDKETFINDMQLLKLVINGERIMFKKEGKWVVIKDHKRVCEECVHTHCINCTYIDVVDYFPNEKQEMTEN